MLFHLALPHVPCCQFFVTVKQMKSRLPYFCMGLTGYALTATCKSLFIVCTVDLAWTEGEPAPHPKHAIRHIGYSRPTPVNRCGTCEMLVGECADHDQYAGTRSMFGRCTFAHIRIPRSIHPLHDSNCLTKRYPASSSGMDIRGRTAAPASRAHGKWQTASYCMICPNVVLHKSWVL